MKVAITSVLICFRLLFIEILDTVYLPYIKNAVLLLSIIILSLQLNFRLFISFDNKETNITIKLNDRKKLTRFAFHKKLIE